MSLRRVMAEVARWVRDVSTVIWLPTNERIYDIG